MSLKTYNILSIQNYVSMKEEELLFHYPYSIDKELNLRQFRNDAQGFVCRTIPNYDGSNIYDFIRTNLLLNSKRKHDLVYDYFEHRKFVEWYKSGRNIFSFSRDLLFMLDKTDVNEITPDKFHLPYDVFYLSLKPLELEIDFDSNKIIEGVYVDYNYWDDNGEHPDGYCDLKLRFVGDFKDIHSKYSTSVISTIPLNESNITEQDQSPLGNFWDTFLRFDKNIGVENVKQAIEEFLKNLREEIFPRKGSNKLVSDIELDFYNSSIDVLGKTIGLVVNCLLYLSQPKNKIDVEIEHPSGLPHNLNRKLRTAKTDREKTKIEQKINGCGFSKINYIGRSYKSQNIGNNITSGMHSSHWRRGHWRSQKFGPGLLKEKLIWILPTIVNSNNGNPQKGHLYDVN